MIAAGRSSSASEAWESTNSTLEIERSETCLIPRYTLPTRNEFTAVIVRDGEWFVAWSPEIPGANGQGCSVEECRESLGAAIQPILEDRREVRAIQR
jgi:predicted RNase H-like HicB family nuclease